LASLEVIGICSKFIRDVSINLLVTKLYDPVSKFICIYFKDALFRSKFAHACVKLWGTFSKFYTHF